LLSRRATLPRSRKHTEMKPWRKPSAKEDKYGIPKGSWIPKNTVTNCYCCAAKFSFITKKKHHCRLCGNVVCNLCSESRLPVPGSDKVKRVCLKCLHSDVTGIEPATSNQSRKSELQRYIRHKTRSWASPSAPLHGDNTTKLKKDGSGEEKVNASANTISHRGGGVTGGHASSQSLPTLGKKKQSILERYCSSSEEDEEKHYSPTPAPPTAPPAPPAPSAPPMATPPPPLPITTKDTRKDDNDDVPSSKGKCGVCTQSIKDHQPAILLERSKCAVHKECFNCTECKETLIGCSKTYVLTMDEYRLKGGNTNEQLLNFIVPLCENHYKHRCGTFCSGCSLLLEGSFFKVGQSSYHPECMRCNDCNVQVNKGTIGPPKIINDIIRCDR
jgi:hypothetical protein